MDGLQKQLERAMASQNYGEALVAVDALKRALECAESEASASEALDDSEALGPSTSDGASETEGDGRSGRRARLRPVASLVVSPVAAPRERRPRLPSEEVVEERSLVVSPGKASRDDDVDFVSDAVSMQKIFHLATGATGAGTRRVSVALHRVGGALVLDGALDDRLEDEASSWGDVDPETGEIIVMVKQKARSREKAAAALAAEGDATNLDNVELVEKGTCSKGEWHQFLSYYDDETEPEADESSDVKVAPIEGALQKRRQAHPELGEPAPFERVVRWRFDGIEMLLGSDTVVYSREGAAGAERVGVHVRDVGQRVTEVAALDMWLENTISGADDAAICYHKDGHVMGYQLVRTEDLPSFARTPAKRLAPDGDGATAVATLERAKSILRFVQRHCTDDAATYCLTRKGGDDGEAIELWRVDDDKGRESSGPARATPFARACALLCLRIARRVERGDRARCRRLLDRCVALADARSDAAVVAEAHLLVALSHEPVDARLDAALATFGGDALGARAAPPWRASAPRGGGGVSPARDAPAPCGDLEDALKSVATRSALGLAALQRAERRAAPRRGRDSDDTPSSARGASKKRDSGAVGARLRRAGADARLGLAALAFSRRRPALALRHLAFAYAADPAAAAAPAFKLRLALVYALLAARVDAASLDDHRGDLGDRPPKPRRFSGSPPPAPAPDGSDDDAPAPRPPKPGPLPAKILREFPVECSPDVEVNLSRGIKALISALRGGEAPAPAPAPDRPRRRRKDAPADGNDLRACAAALVALYTALGEHYLAVDRLTKAARHWSQGVELFKGLGDARSAAWLRARLAWAQLKLQDREGGAPTAAKRYAKTKAALAALEAALADVADEPESGGGAGVLLPGVDTLGVLEALAVARADVAREGVRLAAAAPTPADAEAALLAAAAAAEAAGADAVVADARYRCAALAARRDGGATVPADAVAHFRAAVAAAERAASTGDARANALEALSMRVDLATVLLRDPDDAGRRALDVVLGAADALEIAARAAGGDEAGCGPVVCRALLDKLQTVLKLQVQKASLDQILAPPPDPAHLAAWKAAYAAALRMGADFDDDAPRLLALLRRTRDEAPTLAQDLA